VSAQEGQTIRNLMIESFTNPFPSVVFSYATGNRQDMDEVGFGPGMIYTEFLARKLHETGIKTFSGLHVDAGENWEVILSKISGRGSQCKVLVVILNPALYLSKPCLKEIYTALCCKKIPSCLRGPSQKMRKTGGP